MIKGVAAADDEDRYWMERAVDLACRAGASGEVPVGAVLVREGAMLGQGWNQSIGACDPTAHAEMLAMRAAAVASGNYRLVNCTLYATLEPCPMCAGAMIHARITRLVFGAADPRAGAAGSVFNLLQTEVLNHRLQIVGGVLAEECGSLLRDFFRVRRNHKPVSGAEVLLNAG